MTTSAPEPKRSPAGDRDRPALPEQTGDDLDLGWGERTGDSDDDERFLQERPPHWE